MLAVPPESSILATMTLCWWNQRQLHIPILVNQFVPYQSFLLVIMMFLVKSFLIIFIRWLEKNLEVLKVILFFYFYSCSSSHSSSGGSFFFQGVQTMESKRAVLAKIKRPSLLATLIDHFGKNKKKRPSFSCFHKN